MHMEDVYPPDPSDSDDNTIANTQAKRRRVGYYHHEGEGGSPRVDVRDTTSRHNKIWN